MSSGDASLHGDMSVRIAVDTGAMDWTPSPGGHVYRKRVHLVGGAEAGQVTSIVRYEPGSTFPAHDHPEGEEILVLDGVFSDEHGDWGAGSYLLNPEGFRHAPFSREGCLIFVKLRQYGGPGRTHVCVDVESIPWQSTEIAGVEVRSLYSDEKFRDQMRLERWAPGAGPGERCYPGGVEIFVIEGAFEDAEGAYPTGSWLRLPDGASQRPSSSEGCRLYVKTGGVLSLRSG